MPVMPGPINSQPQSHQWLTVRRLRTQALILLIVMWSAFAWDYAVPGLRDRAGQIKGADFLHLYSIGTLAREHRGSDLYHMAAQEAVIAQRVPEAAGMRYLPLYPPQVSVLLAPLAGFRYGTALLIWSFCSLTLYGLCLLAIVRVCPGLRTHMLTVAICAAAYPAFWHLIAWGQTSALALASFVLAYLALKSNLRFLAGLALGCLIYKPQLGLAAALVCLLSGEWTVIAGGILLATLQLALAWAYYGPGPLLDWAGAITHVSSQMNLLEPRPFQTHCLRTFWTMLLPWTWLSGALYVVCATAATLATVKCWRSRATLDLRFSALLLATVLISPHLTVYDLVILAPALLLLSERAVNALSVGTALRWLLYLTYALPLLGPLARWSHIQLSVLAMASLLAWIATACGSRRLPLVCNVK